MSNRKKAFKSESSNPATLFLEWKSEQQCFAYYDKNQGKEVEIPLPFKFLTLQEMHTVKGWQDSSSSGIYSNEVKSIGKDVISVKSFKGGQIAEGIYKEIKDTIVQAGGHYAKSIYAMNEEGQIINISLKGSGVQQWGEFTQKSRLRLPEEWVEVSSAIQLKKGRVNYSVPEFKYKSSLTGGESEMADEAFDVLEEYLIPSKRESALSQEDEDKDLPF